MNAPPLSPGTISEMDWLGEVPRGWDITPLKVVASCNDDVLDEATPVDYQINYVEISGVSSDEGIREQSAMPFGDAPSRARRRVRDGDIIISTVRTYLRAIASVKCPPENLIVSTGFAVIRPKLIDSAFLSYVLQAEYFISQVISRSVGVSYPAINSAELVRIKVPVPPPRQQEAIAKLLNRQIKVIDDLISEQQILITLLGEKREATIYREVTRGLNSTAQMKESGLAWLGSVPAHWQLKRLKHIGFVVGRIGFRGYTAGDLVDEGDGALALGGTNVGDRGLLNLEKRTYISWEKYEESPEIRVNRNDILIGQRGSCGEVALVSDEIGPATINPSLVIVKQSILNPRFLLYWLLSTYVRNVFNSYLSATAVPMLSQEQIGNIPLCHPPIKEQERIVESLDHKLEKLDALIGDARKAIALLKERRRSVISAAIIGRVGQTELLSARGNG